MILNSRLFDLAMMGLDDCPCSNSTINWVTPCVYHIMQDFRLAERAGVFDWMDAIAAALKEKAPPPQR